MHDKTENVIDTIPVDQRYVGHFKARCFMTESANMVSTQYTPAYLVDLMMIFCEQPNFM